MLNCYRGVLNEKEFSERLMLVRYKARILPAVIKEYVTIHKQHFEGA